MNFLNFIQNFPDEEILYCSLKRNVTKSVLSVQNVAAKNISCCVTNANIVIIANQYGPVQGIRMHKTVVSILVRCNAPFDQYKKVFLGFRTATAART